MTDQPMFGMTRRTQVGGGQGMIEYGILLGTLALGVVLTLVAIGTQIRTVMTDATQTHGEP
jgi:Flp pilus assembly pilin Flp